MKKQYSILSFALSLFFFSAVTSSNAQKSDVTVSRSVSAAQMAADGRPMVVVTVTIHKFKFTGPGRIEEDFSSDFQALVISNNRATFQTGGGKAYFTWSNIQEDMTITVSYALEALNKTEASQTINGKFFYQNQAFPIAASSFTIDASNLPAYKAPPAQDYSPLDDVFYAVTGNNMDGTTRPTPGAVVPASTTPASSSMASSASSTQSSPSTTSAPMQTTSSSSPSTTSAPMQVSSSSPVATAPDNSSASNTSTSQQNSTPQSTPVSTPVASSAPDNSSTANNSSSSQQSSSNSSSSMPATSSAPVGGASAPGLVYRVQIIVVGDKSKLSGFLRHYNITDQPVYDPADGTPVRVMVGNYGNYNAAKARASELKNKGLAGAFVAPYYNGQRISMADAASHTAH